ncbi:MAG: 50S ribosomal protein L11 methyltransferase [Alphaproteobacteria bacterium]|nr:50S ribosomal protein L11 methyltransferase [Alphaproteobacteria bacterium]
MASSSVPEPARRPWRTTLVVDATSAPAFEQALEDLAQSLASFEVKPGGPWRLDAIFAAEHPRAEVESRLALAAASLGCAQPAAVFEEVPDVDWVSENQRSFPPLRIGRFYVRGSHIEGASPAGAWTIELDAGIAFGSGEHATTQGCLRAIESAAKRRRGRPLGLDLGCGSAILAIGMVRGGARAVVASDIDSDSVRVAQENLRLNAAARHVRAVVSDGFARLPRKRGFDIAVANILARPLVRLSRDLARAVRPGGTLILSGLLADQEREVRAAYVGHRLAFVGRHAIAGWHTLVFRKR